MNKIEAKKVCRELTDKSDMRGREHYSCEIQRMKINNSEWKVYVFEVNPDNGKKLPMFTLYEEVISYAKWNGFTLFIEANGFEPCYCLI